MPRVFWPLKPIFRSLIPISLNCRPYSTAIPPLESLRFALGESENGLRFFSFRELLTPSPLLLKKEERVRGVFCEVGAGVLFENPVLGGIVVEGRNHPP